MDDDMTTTTHDDHTAVTGESPGPGSEAGGEAEYAQAWQQAWTGSVQALTAAARLTHDPRCGRLDFADFLAEVLASVTANVGGVDRVLAGRSGSWEADLVEQLLRGTVGCCPDEADLLRRRTEPIVIHLNVARLVEEYGGAPGRWRWWAVDDTPYDHELSQLYERHEEERAARRAHGGVIDDALYAEQYAEVEVVTAAWAARYTAYADTFTAAVTTAAAAIPGLTVPVTVEAITDPDTFPEDGPDHPHEPDHTHDPDRDHRYDADPLIWRLWTAGLAAVGPIPDTTPTGGGDDH